MNYTIKIKGGQENDIPQLKPRELGYCTDSGKAFIGTETGNKDFFKVINDKIGNGFTSENTITSQMNNKADLESPTLTGTPTINNNNILTDEIITSTMTINNGTVQFNLNSLIKKGNVVNLALCVNIALTANEKVATLPIGFRPRKSVYNVAVKNATGKSMAIVCVSTTGEIVLQTTENTATSTTDYIMGFSYLV